MIQRINSAKTRITSPLRSQATFCPISFALVLSIPSSQHALVLQDTLTRTCASSTNSGSQATEKRGTAAVSAVSLPCIRRASICPAHRQSSIHHTYLPTLPVQDLYVLSQNDFLVKHPTSNVRQSIYINFTHQVLHSCIPTSKIRYATIVRVPDFRAQQQYYAY